MNHDHASIDHPEMAVNLLRHVVVGLVRRDGIALSTQQFGVFLACYLCKEANTLRGLVQELDMPRLVVARAMDKLVELDLIRREPDLRDTRNQIIHHTEAGQKMLVDLGALASGVSAPQHVAG